MESALEVKPEEAESRKKGPSWTGWENVREKVCLCPSSAWTFTTETVQKGDQREKTPLGSFPGVDISEKLVVFLPSHAAPQSPMSNQQED